jgi:hypothetical protein
MEYVHIHVKTHLMCQKKCLSVTDSTVTINWMFHGFVNELIKLLHIFLVPIPMHEHGK